MDPAAGRPLRAAAKERPNSVSLQPNVLSVATGNIGDLLAAVPAMNALSRHFGAPLTLLAHPSAGSLLRGHPSVGHILNDDAARGERDIIADIRARGFTHAIVFWSTARNARIVHRAKIPTRVGPAGRLYSRFRYTMPLRMRADSGDTQTHAAENLMDNARALGASPQPTDYRIELALDAEDERRAEQALSAAGIREPFIAMHAVRELRPGVRWPVGRFAALGDALAERFGAPIVLVGSASERAVVSDIASAMRGTSANLAGSTDLRALAALFAKSVVVVGLDSGPAHIAAAAGAPTVAIFALRNDLPDRWRPLGAAVRVVGSSYACPRHCRKETCRDFKCYAALETDIVVAAAVEVSRASAAPQPAQR